MDVLRTESDVRRSVLLPGRCIRNAQTETLVQTDWLIQGPMLARLSMAAR
jgi:hypothetical protein